MLTLHPFRRRVAVIVAAACVGVTLAGTATAIDLRDWGRKYPASERFAVLAQFDNEAVLDKETQLVWQRYGSNDVLPQRNAYFRCAAAAIGGRMGWRLPTIAELASLIDPRASGAVKLPAGHPFRMVDGQPLPAEKYFWSSTFDVITHRNLAFSTSMDMYRHLATSLGTVPGVGTLSSTTDNYYICVRGADPSNAN